MSATLRDKFRGCIAGSFIGSAMAAAVEGPTWPELAESRGRVRTLLPYGDVDWERPAGTTEEGVERQKRIIEAILEHRRRVTAEEVVGLWASTVDDDAASRVHEPYEVRSLRMAAVGVPARDLGGYTDLTAQVAFGAAAQPLGLINAGDPESARLDVLEVGQLYQAAGGKGLLWAVATGVGVAEATRPGADIASVLTRILELCDPNWVSKELRKHLAATAAIVDADGLRAYFDDVYGGIGVKYALSHANEVVTKALCVFRLTGEDLATTIETAVNFGRDSSSLAAIAAGLSGALVGPSGLDPVWETTVDAATAAHPYTVSRASIAEVADGLYDVYRERIAGTRDYISRMASA